MRVISLNVWGGQLYDKLEAFVKSNAQITDVFCFQEMFDGKPVSPRMTHAAEVAFPNVCYDVTNRISRILPDYERVISDEYTTLGLRLTTFYKNTLDVEKAGNVPITPALTIHYNGVVFKQKSVLQYIVLKDGVIASSHGVFLEIAANAPPGIGSNDQPQRIEQSKKYNKVLSRFNGWKVFAGDLNLNMTTQSIKIIEKPMRNLVKESGARTTRNAYASPKVAPYADYMFVTPDVKVSSFEVMPDVVSDHQPLMISFEPK